MTMTTLDTLQGQELARYARGAIAHALGGPEVPPLQGEIFHQNAATFVTLRQPNGELHGCIGRLEASRPLAEDVAKNAVAAALYDPRAPVITLAQVPALGVEISVLSPMEPIEYDGTEEGALKALVPFRDGVVLQRGFRRGTFLPQVWESLPTPRDFMRHLKMKAGLPAEGWSPDITLKRYRCTKHAISTTPAATGSNATSARVTAR